MPGILPMKVIKVGNSSQSRIAQACDRCRSKKIRCDGIRPTCTQCSSVGFECRTSDKLSRRAFPRGYTESLEERVRHLETEINELKDLLDEKDEKIDMLSKMHGNQRTSISCEPCSPSTVSPDSSRDAPNVKEDTFRVQASPLLLGVENSDSFFMGPSSGRSFIDTFKRKIQEAGKPCKDFNPEAFLHIQGCAPLASQLTESLQSAPPRLFSDRCVNVYFQEWAPLFPVLHKPTFLRIYEEFVLDPARIKSSHQKAQLFLVFGIAGLSSESPDMEVVAACESQWMSALDQVLMESNMLTLQCLVLALMYCTVRADYKRLQHYKAIATGLSHRLGLNQSQKRFSFGALTIETRKKVFWTLYTLDCFTAATLGLPKHLKEDDIQTEYPSDTDDDYVTEKGFLPTLPGESTRISNALALFRGVRILGEVLEKLYPSTVSQELSLQQMGALENELDEWYRSLPPHLRLNFSQDKPSTDITGSRSPLLALAYYHIRQLIYRPAIGSSLGQKAAPALLSISDSSKRIIQITQLLEERNMTFSICLNKSDVLVVSGMTLLYRVIDLNLKNNSKLMRDDERLIKAVLQNLEKCRATGWMALKRVASMFVSLDGSSPNPVTSSALVPTTRDTSEPATRQHTSTLTGYRKTKDATTAQKLGRRGDASASETDLLQQQDKLRRMTMPSSNGSRPDLVASRPRQSLDGLSLEAMPTAQAPYHSATQLLSTVDSHGTVQTASGQPNLDYLSFGNTPSQSDPSTPAPGSMRPPPSRTSQNGQGTTVPDQSGKYSEMSNVEWEAMLGSLDCGLNNVYDAIYGGPGFMMNDSSMSSRTNPSEWSPDSWDLSSFNIADIGSNSGAPQSVLSMSDESLSSGEEVGPSELGLSSSSVDYHGQMLSQPCNNGDGFYYDGTEGFRA